MTPKVDSFMDWSHEENTGIVPIILFVVQGMMFTITEDLECLPESVDEFIVPEDKSDQNHVSIVWINACHHQPSMESQLLGKAKENLPSAEVGRAKD